MAEIPPGARPCRLCGIGLEFHRGPTGRWVPVVRIRQAYALSAGALAKVEAAGDLFVNHYETCPPVRRGVRP